MLCIRRSSKNGGRLSVPLQVKVMRASRQDTVRRLAGQPPGHAGGKPRDGHRQLRAGIDLAERRVERQADRGSTRRAVTIEVSGATNVWNVASTHTLIDWSIKV
jgi:hypothetical protein